MNDGDKTKKTQEELKAAISEKKEVWMAKPNGTVGLLERSEVYEVRKVKDCLVNMLAYASDLEQGLRSLISGASSIMTGQQNKFDNFLGFLHLILAPVGL